MHGTVGKRNAENFDEKIHLKSAKCIFSPFLFDWIFSENKFIHLLYSISWLILSSIHPSIYLYVKWNMCAC